MIPILIEVDRQVPIVIKAKSIFNSHEVSVSFESNENRPTVFEIGPLQVLLLFLLIKFSMLLVGK